MRIGACLLCAMGIDATLLKARIPAEKERGVLAVPHPAARTDKDFCAETRCREKNSRSGLRRESKARERGTADHEQPSHTLWICHSLLDRFLDLASLDSSLCLSLFFMLSCDPLSQTK